LVFKQLKPGGRRGWFSPEKREKFFGGTGGLIACLGDRE